MNKAFLTCDITIKGDECYTPRYAVLPILKYLKPNSRIWCPFDNGSSEFVKVLQEAGHTVCHTHIYNGSDFFEMNLATSDYIISNPPYSIKDKIIKRLYELNIPFMMLMPLTTLQGKARYNSFKNGVQLLAFDSRIGFYTNGDLEKTKEGNWFASAYFCRNVLPNDLIIEKLEKECK